MKALVTLLSFLLLSAPAGAAAPEEIMANWYTLLLNLVRHTATYSPPVASRAFAYVGVTAYEATASGDDHLVTLAGQLNGLQELPRREMGKAYDEGVVLNAALDAAIKDFFPNTGPSGQHVMAAHSKSMKAETAKGVTPDVVARSVAFGVKLEKAILAWSRTDGGAVIENLGFPKVYAVSKEPGHWVPTNSYQIQQHPLLPKWGKNRSFAMPDGTSCPLPPPPAYSEDQQSAFFKQAKEVYDTKNNLTPEQKTIARFWSDDPGLSWTPPGHWVGIVLDLMQEKHLSAAKASEALAKVGIAIADGFIGCWQVKYEYDFIRPVTFIKKKIDPKWEALLITPPFPEYPSGHSTQTGAAAVALASVFGDAYAFDDTTHERDGLSVRHFTGFWQAAEEAGISRLYGGIHFRAAVEQGLNQGKCIGAYAAKLRMEK
jgi:membrane-associated phospholipid phosphatase